MGEVVKASALQGPVGEAPEVRTCCCADKVAEFAGLAPLDDRK